MHMNKNELHTLKYLSFYKCFLIASMCISASGIPLGLYARYYRFHMESQLRLNDALIGASMVVLGLSYMSYHFLKLIEKLWFKVSQGSQIESDKS